MAIHQFLISFILLSLISFPKSFSQQSPAYLAFVSNATEFPIEDYYDYIVVGGGTAGCPLATTLSSRFRVLVLERGGVPFGNTNLMSQDGFLTALVEVDAFDSPAQAFTSEDGVPNARGRVLGGSSAINAGFYSRADNEFYKKSLIDFGDRRLVNESYEWVEEKIVFRPVVREWQRSFRDGLIEAGVGRFNGFELNHVHGTKIGGSIFDSEGVRHSAADLLSYADKERIEVVLFASVERVLLARSVAGSVSAIGVVFRDRNGGYHHAMLKDGGEVVLAAGALGTPQLLLLSGVGPREYLASMGIPVGHHSPYVGRFMYDNPRNAISIVPPVQLDHSLIQVVGITESGAYLEAASNIVPFTSPATPFIRSPSYLTVATLMEKVVGPVSSGTLRLSSTDVRANPVVQFNYFSDAGDLARCINGTRILGHVLNSRAMNVFRIRQWFGRSDFRYAGSALPIDQSNDALMGEFCRRTVTTIWHYHGGCLAGRVVDRDLKVIGINALRIVDGSTFTVSPGTNPQATVLMMGRYFGVKMLRERMSRTSSM